MPHPERALNAKPVDVFDIVAFTRCRLAGATLEGIPLEDMVAAYRAAQAG